MEPYSFADSSQSDKIVFGGNSITAGGNWHTWTKPIGKSMASIIAIGGGGGGGLGVIGANSTAGGGGGGGSGAMIVMDIPLALLPNVLYVSVGYAKQGSGIASYVSTQPNIAANHVVAVANGGSAGGDATGGVRGAIGAAGALSTAATMPLGWPFARVSLVGHPGGLGGSSTTGGNISLPTTGIHVTGGTGGGGLPAAAKTGTSSGVLTVTGSPSYFPAQTAVVGPGSASVPATPGKSGFSVRDAGFYYYGGTGSSSTHGSATGAGLVQAAGGNGGVGSGGGGMGGALTGSTPATLSYGGPGMVIITCY